MVNCLWFTSFDALNSSNLANHGCLYIFLVSNSPSPVKKLTANAQQAFDLAGELYSLTQQWHLFNSTGRNIVNSITQSKVEVWYIYIIPVWYWSGCIFFWIMFFSFKIQGQSSTLQGNWSFFRIPLWSTLINCFWNGYSSDSMCYVFYRSCQVLIHLIAGKAGQTNEQNWRSVYCTRETRRAPTAKNWRTIAPFVISYLASVGIW